MTESQRDDLLIAMDLVIASIAEGKPNSTYIDVLCNFLKKAMDQDIAEKKRVGKPA